MSHSFYTSNHSVVFSYRDGLVTFPTYVGAQSGELVFVFSLENPLLQSSALIMSLTPTWTDALLLDDAPVTEGWGVYSTESTITIPAGLNLFGTIVNSLGVDVLNEQNAESLSSLQHSFSIENRAPNILDRKSVHQPLHSGLKSVDSLIPIGLGQRELIIGDRQTGKTTICFDLWQNQTNLNFFLNNVYNFNSTFSLNYLTGLIFVIYVAIAQKRSTVMNLFQSACKHNMMQFGSIVAATAGESAPMQFLAPYTACTLGEYVRDYIGGHAVLIYDDLSKHAIAYRQMSLLLRRPPGREAFPGDVFYIHSRLLERAAKLSEDNKSGSLTALPIIETQAGDVSAYIPTNVISITDGQIFLETDLFYAGVRPAINAGLSVSRVGSSAQLTAMKQIAGSLKLELAQFREVESFAKLGASLDSNTKKLINRGIVITEVLKQKNNKPMLIFLQLLLLFTAGSGYLDEMKSVNIDIFFTFIEYFFKKNGFWFFFERQENTSLMFKNLSLLHVLYGAIKYSILNASFES